MICRHEKTYKSTLQLEINEKSRMERNDVFVLLFGCLIKSFVYAIAFWSCKIQEKHQHQRNTSLNLT
jgi:hypothetical protein